MSAVIPACVNVYKEGRISRWQFHTNDNAVIAFHCRREKIKEALNLLLWHRWNQAGLFSFLFFFFGPLKPVTLETSLKHLFWFVFWQSLPGITVKLEIRIQHCAILLRF